MDEQWAGGGSFETLGDRLRKAMKQAGMKNPEAAAVAGVDVATVSRWRSDRQVPDDEQLRPLAEKLETTVSRLRYGSTGAPPYVGPSSGSRDASRARVTELLQEASEFPKRVRERIKEIELELTRMGAAREFVDGFEISLRANRGFMSVFSGGAPANITNEQYMQLLEGAATNYLAIVKIAMRRKAAEATNG